MASSLLLRTCRRSSVASTVAPIFRSTPSPCLLALQHSMWQWLPAKQLSTQEISVADVPLAEHHVPKRLHTQFDGVVVSTAMQKSIVVAVTRTRLIRKYNKRQRYTRKFMAHDEDELCELGDRVRIQMSRPISKMKTFKYVRMLQKAKKL